MKRLNVKGILLFAILIGIVIGGILILVFPKKDKTPPKEKKQEVSYYEKVEKKLKDKVDSSFLEWVNKEYPESIKELSNLLEKKEYQESIWHEATGYSYLVLQDLKENKYDSMNNVKILDKTSSTISIVGDVSLADNWYIAPKYDSRGGITGILSEDILNIMKDSDLMIANSEFTISSRGSAMPGKLYTFRAKPERVDIYPEMGVDLLTLANNHVYDFGQDAFLDMLDILNEKKMPYIGAGRNIEEAKKPYYYILGGYKFAFVNATRAEKYKLTPGATEDSEGVFRCYDSGLLLEEVKSLRQESDYVVAIIHYGREDSHELEEEQIKLSHDLIDSGADIVVGHHAHTLQGIEVYNHKPIIYNLGNYLFNDQTDDTAIFQISMKENNTMYYQIIPAIQTNCKTSLLVEDDKQRVINNINKWSINAHLNEDGYLGEG